MSELEIDFSILAGLFWPFLDAKWGKRVLWFNLEMKSEELEQWLALYITPPQGCCGEEKKNGAQKILFMILWLILAVSVVICFFIPMNHLNNSWLPRI